MVSSDIETVKYLREKQKSLLEFSENWGDAHSIDGIKITKALSYFTIQFLNRLTIQSLVEKEKE
jgi:hypothetical protein